MPYDTKKLRKLALKILGLARKNLKKHGALQPVGLAYLPNGQVDTFIFLWKNLAEKRRVQRDFQVKLLSTTAVAAVIVTEVWAKFAEDGPIDVNDPRSVRDQPGRRDAILVEAGSPLGRVVLVQTFTKTGPKKVRFDKPQEFTTGMGDFSSEFMDAVWPGTRDPNQRLH